MYLIELHYRLFPSIDNRVTDYEVRYRVSNEEWKSIKIPASSVDTDGKIRYDINNIARRYGVARVYFEITPLNKELRGASVKISKVIEGKTIPPKTVTDFVATQEDFKITLTWNYFNNNNDITPNIDLKDVTIYQVVGTRTQITPEVMRASSIVATVTAGQTSVVIPTQYTGETTFFARTRNTSGIYSEEVAIISLNIITPSATRQVQAMSESRPQEHYANLTFLYDNFTEDNFPSVRKRPAPLSNVLSNASGFATTTIVGSSQIDFLTVNTANSWYETAFRDVGTEIDGEIHIVANVTSFNDANIGNQEEKILTGNTAKFVSQNNYVSPWETTSNTSNYGVMNVDTRPGTPRVGTFRGLRPYSSRPNNWPHDGAIAEFDVSGVRNQLIAAGAVKGGYYVAAHRYYDTANSVWSNWNSNVSAHSLQYLNGAISTPKILFSANSNPTANFMSDSSLAIITPNSLDDSNTNLVTGNPIIGSVTISGYLFTRQHFNQRAGTIGIISGRGTIQWDLRAGDTTEALPSGTIITLTSNSHTVRLRLNVGIGAADTRIGIFLSNMTILSGNLNNFNEGDLITTTIQPSNSRPIDRNLRFLVTNQKIYQAYFGTRAWERYVGDSREPTSEVRGSITNIFTDQNLIDAPIGEYFQALSNVRYDYINKTLMSGNASGNVYALKTNTGTALIAGLTEDGKGLVLGETFYANGVSTNSNNFAFSNAISSNISYTLVNQFQYNDIDASTQTYLGDLVGANSKIEIRTSSKQPYQSLINQQTRDTANTENIHDYNNGKQGWKPYSTELRNFRYYQIRLSLVNPKHDAYDTKIEDFDYRILKKQESKTFTTSLPGGATGTTVDISSLGFLNPPTIVAQPLPIVDVEGARVVLINPFLTTSTSFTASVIVTRTGAVSAHTVTASFVLTGV